MNYAKACGLALVGGLGLVAAQSAQAVTLSSVSSFTSNGLTYSNFHYTENAGGPTASGIEITPVSSGLLFTGGWNSVLNPTFTAEISYDVTPADVTTTSINGGTLTISGVAATGGSTVGATEMFGTGGALGSISVTDTNKQGSTTFAAQSGTVTIVQDISLTRGTTGGSPHAALSFVSNTFTNGGGNGTPPPVPEPMTLALIPMGLVGLGLRKKLAR